MPSEIIKNCTGHTHNTYIFQYILKAQRAILVDFPSGVCVFVCVFTVVIWEIVLSCANPACLPLHRHQRCHLSVRVGVCVWLACVQCFIFLCMKTSDWTKYHGTHQGKMHTV